MLYALIAGLIMLAMLDRTLRSGRVERAIADARHELLVLEGELEAELVEGRIREADQDAYAWMTDLIESTADLAFIAEPLEVLIILVFARKEIAARPNLDLDRAFARARNPVLRGTQDRFFAILRAYMLRRYPVAIWALSGAFGLSAKTEALKTRVLALMGSESGMRLLRSGLRFV